jgi:CTP:molybdopterin cytidylyltransferase MocA
MTNRDRPTLLVFQGGAFHSPTPLETLVVQAQHAATLDLLALASTSAVFDQVVLVTDDDTLAASASALVQAHADVPLHIEQTDPDTFHFGETLLRVCKAHSIERVVYIGGGAMPLGTLEELERLAGSVSGAGQCVTANNLYSADMVAFYPASALERIELPTTDNDLAWRLYYRAGLPFAATPRTLATQFDIDTPADLVTLWQSTRRDIGETHSPAGLSAGPLLSQLLTGIPQAMPRLAENMVHTYDIMSTKRSQLLVAGRVSSWVWRRLEVNLPCQTRVFSEERGMQAGGREARGEVRSLLGLYMDARGVHGLMEALEQLCDAAIIDSRVLFAHQRLTVSRPDRFASDALLPEQISDGWVRKLTEAVLTASVPIVLGGHSLISGGVWALSEKVRTSSSAARG